MRKFSSTGLPPMYAAVAIEIHERDKRHNKAIAKLGKRLKLKGAFGFTILSNKDGMLEYSYTIAGGCIVYDDLDLDFKGMVDDAWGHFSI